MMHSSIEKLGELANTLHFMTIGHDGSGLYRAGWYAELISGVFSDNNSELSKGWSTVGDTCKQVDASAREVIKAFSNDIFKFIDQTRSNENTAAAAVNVANEKAYDVLSQLGIIQEIPTKKDIKD